MQCCQLLFYLIDGVNEQLWVWSSVWLNCVKHVGYSAKIWIQGFTIWSYELGSITVLPFSSYMLQSDSQLLHSIESLPFSELLFLYRDSPKPFHIQKVEQRLRTWNLASDRSSWIRFLTFTSYVILKKFPKLSKTQFLHLENENKISIISRAGCEALVKKCS